MSTHNTVKVWDPLLRIFHWSLAGTFTFAYLTGDEWDTLHTIAGYMIAGLIAFRLAWGIIGTRYARFTQFIRSPKTVIDHLKKMKSGKAPHYLGHNPAAAAMIVALLLSISMTALTGMSIIATEGSGPLAGTFISHINSNWLEEFHEFFANGTLVLIGLHLLGVLVSSVLEKENLARAMITGLKRKRPDAVDQRK
jgi:cytochrome b